jgi:malonate-semialdehyde dehydrogenase (acetylating)/methylmalonate-semialdehyde dehydrogenase
VRTVCHWIGGRSETGTGARTGPVWNPATGQQQAEVRYAAAADVDRAVAAAGEAFPGWSQTSLTQRAKVLFAFRELVNQHAAELAGVISDEHGKVFADALGEVQRGLEVVEFACGLPGLLKGSYSDQVSTGVDTFSFREPLGIVAGITPFNFPVMVPMWMHPIAIACGNTFVLKPSERDPTASEVTARLWHEAGLPPGVFNVVQGDREAVDRLLDHPDIAAVSFVGSTPIAEYVHSRAAASGKRVQALGGAKNHAVVLPDADPTFAAQQLSAAAFGSAGERCMAISAAVAVGAAAEPLIENLKDAATGVRVGPGRDPDSDMGPVITAGARDRIAGLIESGAREGARIVVDGRKTVVSGYEDGFFLGPTILDEVTAEMEVYREEVFGPVLSVLRAADAAEAIRIVNDNPYGNGTAIFTASGEAARTFQRGVRVGMIGVNVPIPVPASYYSFGGWKRSLFGESHIYGEEGVAFYTRGKVVTSRWPRPAAAPGYNFPSS